MKTNKTRNLLARGFTLIEILVVVVIVGGLIAFLANKFQQSQTGIAANEDNQLVTTIYNKMQSQRTNPGYGTLAYNSYLLTQSVWDPKRFTLATNSGVTTVTAQDAGTWTITGNTANFTATRTAYPAGACVSLLTGLSPQQYVSVTIGTTTTATPINGSAATTQCGTTGTITVILNSTN
jgi:prepilin-type N-terminal cleavage/methylation domain-containing protein